MLDDETACNRAQIQTAVITTFRVPEIEKKKSRENRNLKIVELSKINVVKFKIIISDSGSVSPENFFAQITFIFFRIVLHILKYYSYRYFLCVYLVGNV